MKLSELLNKAQIDHRQIDDVEITDIVTDSRKADYRCMFICLSGGRDDGHRYIRRALMNGAVAVVIQNDTEIDISEDFGKIKIIKVESTRSAAAKLYNVWYGSPSDKLKIIGVTGTNGKTSVTYILKNIFEAALYKCGVIGTISCLSGGRSLSASPDDPLANMTTPDPRELYRTLAFMAADGVEFVFMEVSSHALKLRKTDAIMFDTAIFTNLTPEHLDFHGNMDDYKKSKSRFFENCKTALINRDDEASEYMIKHACGRVLTYSANGGNADYKALDVLTSSDGINYTMHSKNTVMRIKSQLKGLFNVYNTLAAVGCALHYEISPLIIDDALISLNGIKGRMARVRLHPKCDFSVYIDYAHTPDALKNLLREAKEICREGRVILLFGCGGDRDKEKRSVMGEIASELADIVIVTSDNSRSEDPNDIIEEILSGFDRATPHSIIKDRRDAIKFAVATAMKDDIILLAGKGHEKYEIDNTGKHPFDEEKIVTDAVNERFERLGQQK